MDESFMPTVIITDCELALMNAIESIFPVSSHLLCRWHIGKNILTKCKNLFRTSEKWDSFCSSWNVVLLAENEATFFVALNRFQEDYADHPAAVQYVVKHGLSHIKKNSYVLGPII